MATSRTPAQPLWISGCPPADVNAAWLCLSDAGVVHAVTDSDGVWQVEGDWKLDAFTLQNPDEITAYMPSSTPCTPTQMELPT